MSLTDLLTKPKALTLIVPAVRKGHAIFGYVGISITHWKRTRLPFKMIATAGMCFITHWKLANIHMCETRMMHGQIEHTADG